MDKQRHSPISMSGDEFRKTGYGLVDSISEFLDSVDQRRVTPGEPPETNAGLIGPRPLPEEGAPATELIGRAAELLFNHSLFNAHPAFMGYITGAPAPIGALGDLLAAVVNPNAGAQALSPMATEIEKQTISWLAELIGLPGSYGGLLVSGGNMANFTAFLAARVARAPEGFKKKGGAGLPVMPVYCSRATHTWVEKATALFGPGTESIRWIDADEGNRIDTDHLERAVQRDREAGHLPFLVIGNAGDVSTGSVDDLSALAETSRKHGLWFHIDGAYGMPAAALPEMANRFRGTGEADSIALDPHKWLYNPLEAGCTLVKDPAHLVAAYSIHPEYYNFSRSAGAPPLNYYEYGLQNSRGFRALKVWLTLQQAGRQGYVAMIREDIRLAELLFEKARAHPRLEALTHSLSIATFRYLPAGYEPRSTDPYLDKLNESLVNTLQREGNIFVSNAVINGRYGLRACIVNFRTSEADVEKVITASVEAGSRLHKNINP